MLTHEFHNTKLIFCILNLCTVVGLNISEEKHIKNLNPKETGIVGFNIKNPNETRIKLNFEHTLDLVLVIDVSSSMCKYLRIGLEFAKDLLRTIGTSMRYSTTNNLFIYLNFTLLVYVTRNIIVS